MDISSFRSMSALSVSPPKVGPRFAFSGVWQNMAEKSLTLAIIRRYFSQLGENQAQPSPTRSWQGFFFVDVMCLGEVASASCALVRPVDARLALKWYSPYVIALHVAAACKYPSENLGVVGTIRRASLFV
jgi:hypothetical protein